MTLWGHLRKQSFPLELMAHQTVNPMLDWVFFLTYFPTNLFPLGLQHLTASPGRILKIFSSQKITFLQSDDLNWRANFNLSLMCLPVRRGFLQTRLGYNPFSLNFCRIVSVLGLGGIWGGTKKEGIACWGRLDTSMTAPGGLCDKASIKFFRQ